MEAIVQRQRLERLEARRQGEMTVGRAYSDAWRHGLVVLDREQAGRLRDSRGLQNARQERQLRRIRAHSCRAHRSWMPVNYGYEVQIDNHPETSNEDEYHVTGTLYSLTKPLARPGKPGPEWNTMEITLDGPRTIVVVNGVKVTDYTEGEPVPPKKLDLSRSADPSQLRLHRAAKP